MNLGPHKGPLQLSPCGEGNVTISMIKYLHQILEEFIEEIKKSSVTPMAEYLFKMREKIDAAQLPKELAVIFHYMAAQLLFLSQRARRDIQTPVSLLTKRVKNPDRDDWNKLVRCLQYLTAALHMTLILLRGGQPRIGLLIPHIKYMKTARDTPMGHSL